MRGPVTLDAGSGIDPEEIVAIDGHLFSLFLDGSRAGVGFFFFFFFFIVTLTSYASNDMETAVGNRPESRQDRSCAHPDHVTPGAKPLWTKNPQLIGVHPGVRQWY